MRFESYAFIIYMCKSLFIVCDYIICSKSICIHRKYFLKTNPER